MVRPAQTVAAVILIGALACGARTTLDASPAATCAPPTPATRPCTAWQPAGPTHVILGDSFTSIATSCGALVAWTKVATELEFHTSVVAWDGSTASPVAHPALSASEHRGWWELAESHGTFGALAIVEQAGIFPGSSRFVRLDGSGAEQSAILSLDPTSDSLGSTGDGFSCLAQQRPDGPVTLERIDTDGSVTTISLPQGHQGVAFRLVYDDGSFLLHTFHDSSAGQLHWLHHFDAHGVALAPEVALTDDQHGMFGVQLAATAAGAIATWASDGVHAMAIDRDGNVASSVQTLAPHAVAPAWVGRANGDVVVAWRTPLTEQLFVQALAPDATPRGPATELMSDATGVQEVRILVEPNGQRALFLYAEGSLVGALPLRCVD